MSSFLSSYLILVFVSSPVFAMAKRPPELRGGCGYGWTKGTVPGDTCIYGDVTWRIETERYAGKPVYLDLKRGLKVTSVLSKGWFSKGQANAAAHCKAGYQLPTAYPEQEKGLHGNPSEDSDLVALINDGLLEVVPDVSGRDFWSATFDPAGNTKAYYLDNMTLFHGPELGLANVDESLPFSEAVLCVSR